MVQGIVNVLKPPGMTSHDIVSFIRRTYGLKRVGHAGTLDPAAAGVLPVFLGNVTRLIEYQEDADKSYRAEITFGLKTSTGDDTGEILARQAFRMPEKEKIEAVLASFTGESKQMPPMYSAIKIGGKKLYELARSGISVEREARDIVIRDIRLLALTADTVLFDVTCSKGTYIRTLCEDIGAKLDIPAVMSFLVRTRVGSFALADAYSLEEIEADQAKCLLSSEMAVAHLEAIQLDQLSSVHFLNGRSIPYRRMPEEKPFRIYNDQNKFIGIAMVTDTMIIPGKVFHPELCD